MSPHTPPSICPDCGQPLPPNASEKQLKQHRKSLAHKRGLAAVPATTSPSEVAEDEEDEELQALRDLCGPDVPVHQLLPYAENRRHYRALCPTAAAEELLLPPPVLRHPRKECAALDAPFLTPQCGRIPTAPANLADALHSYFCARKDAHPKVTVDEGDRDVGSWAEARRVLQAAEAEGRRYWCTFYLPSMGHPPWYPKACKGPDGRGEGPGSAPTQDQVIIGRGRTGIGIHADKYDVGVEAKADGAGARRRKLCSTCITIARGRKHVLMLPPSCAAPGAADTCAWFGDADAFPLTPERALLRRLIGAGGYLFAIEPVALPADGREDGGGEAAEGEGLALFTPAGWFHWLVGDAPAGGSASGSDGKPADDWHVVFGGSYPPPGGPVL